MSNREEWPWSEFALIEKRKKRIQAEMNKIDKVIDDIEKHKDVVVESKPSLRDRFIGFFKKKEEPAPVEEPKKADDRSIEYTLPDEAQTVWVKITRKDGSTKSYTISNYISIGGGDTIKLTVR